MGSQEPNWASFFGPKRKHEPICHSNSKPEAISNVRLEEDFFIRLPLRSLTEMSGLKYERTDTQVNKDDLIYYRTSYVVNAADNDIVRRQENIYQASAGFSTDWKRQLTRS